MSVPPEADRAAGAEVGFAHTEEFGVEIGLQSPVLFQRSVIPADSTLFGTAGSSSFVNSTRLCSGVGSGPNRSRTPADISSTCASLRDFASCW